MICWFTYIEIRMFRMCKYPILIFNVLAGKGDGRVCDVKKSTFTTWSWTVSYLTLIEYDCANVCALDMCFLYDLSRGAIFLTYHTDAFFHIVVVFWVTLDILVGVKHIIFLERFLSQISWEIKKHCFIDGFSFCFLFL